MPRKGIYRCEFNYRRYEIVKDKFPRYLVRCLNCKKEKWTQVKFTSQGYPKAKDFEER